MKRPFVAFPVAACFVLLVGGVGGGIAAGDERADLFAALKQASATETSDYAAAAKHYETALALAPAVFGENHKNTATILNNLANMYKELGDHKKALELHTRCLKIRQAILAPDDPDMAQSYGNMANLYLATGEYTHAESFGVYALKLREARLAPDDLELADNVNNLAALYHTMGQFEKAEPLLLRSLKIREARLGPEHVATAMSLTNLGNLYSSLGQFEKAEQYLVRALAIKEKALGPNHIDVALAANNLGILYQQTGAKEKALPLLERSLRIKQAVLGGEHPQVALALDNLAISYKQQFQYEKAEPLYLDALKIREAKLGQNHPDVSGTLANLGNLYQETGRYELAEKSYLRCIAIMEDRFGPNYPDLAQKGLFNLALMHAAQDKTPQAAAEFDRARRIVRRYASQVLPILSETEQLKFLANVDRREFHTAITLGWKKPDDANAVALSANWLANGKAVAQETLVQRAGLARDLAKSELATLVAQLQSIRRQLTTLMNIAPKPGQEAAHKAALANLPAQEQDLAKQLATAGGTKLPPVWVEHDAIRKALPAKSVLVDIARFEPTVFAAKAGEKFRLPARYAAWVTPSTGPIRLVDLGEAEPIEAAVVAFQAAMKLCQSGDRTTNPLLKMGEVKAEKELNKSLAAVADLVLKPLLPILEGKDEILLSPDGSLWLVPWAALPVSDKEYAIERWNIHYLTSAREIAPATSERAKSVSGPRIFANPNYNLAASDILPSLNAVLGGLGIAPLAASGETADATGIGGSLRGVNAIGPVPLLPGTASEAAHITPNLTKYAGEPKLYSEQQALEGIFKRMGGPRVLVVSTHGFFMPDPDDAEVAPVPAPKPGDTNPATKPAGTQKVETADKNPLLRCGLLLAGCNNRDQITDRNLDDGVLTGMEIVGTDLRGTELVVLSACETGLGQVRIGEGVSGLRQAFQLAGAQSVVSTLWQIPDIQSAQLMSDFFANLAEGQERSTALRNAQLHRIKIRREKYGVAHPIYWAAFTLTGA